MIMAIGLMEKLSLQKELIAIIGELETAKLLEKLALQKRGFEILTLLDAGGAVADVEPETVPELSLVQRFLAGEFDTSSSSEFISVLTDLSASVGEVISLQQIKDQSHLWWDRTGVKEYNARVGG